MSRLTQGVREKMAVALVKHRFSERAADLIRESQALFHLAYAGLYSPADKKLIDALRKSHRKAFKLAKALNVNVNGRKFEVGSQDIGGYWKAECELLPVLADVDYYYAFPIDREDAHADRFVKFAEDRATLKAEAHRAYEEAVGTLGQFTTGKALAKDWPEALSVVGHLIPEDNRTLPVVQTDKLNADFKLPALEARA